MQTETGSGEVDLEVDLSDSVSFFYKFYSRLFYAPLNKFNYADRLCRIYMKKLAPLCYELKVMVMTDREFN